MSDIRHYVRVRTAEGRRVCVKVQAIKSRDLAKRVGAGVAIFLGQDPKYSIGPRFAWDARRRVEDAGADVGQCSVEVVRRGPRARGGRERVVARYFVAERGLRRVA